MRCIVIIILLLIPLFSRGQADPHRLDSLMKLIPSGGPKRVSLVDWVHDELMKASNEDRIQHARRIVDYIDSSLKENDETSLVTALYLKSRIQKDIFGLNHEALKTALEAAEIAEKIQDDLQLFWCLTQATQISYTIGNNIETIRLGNQVMSLYNKLDPNILKESNAYSVMSFISIYNTVGLAHFNRGQYDSAMKDYDMGEKLAREVKQEFWITLLGASKAMIHKDRGRYNEALAYLLADYAMGKKYIDWKIASSDAMRIAEVYMLKKNLSMAGKYMDSAALFLSRNPEREEELRVDYLQYQAAFESAKGNNNAAYELQKKFTGDRIALINKQQSDLVASIQGSYEFSRHQRAIESLTHNNEIQEREITFQRTLFIGAVITLVLVVGLVMYLIHIYRLQRKATSLIAIQRDEIEKKNTELHSAQSHVVQAEKMAFLGRLTSSVAHEINTPLGAIKASSENALVSFDNLVRYFKEIILDIPGEHMMLIFELLDNGQQQKDVLESRERRALKKTFISELSSAGLENPEETAEHMVHLNVRSDYKKWNPLLKLPRASEIFRLADEAVSLRSQNLNINMAVGKAAKILFALKSYSHQGQSDVATALNVVENVETVLSIYSNNLKDVELVTNFGSVDAIAGYPDELNQVWTNLMHNSLQAMEGHGKLIINITKHSIAELCVEIIDNGKGISAENQKSIFQPFFTTKASGEGTGLGLSIVKKIVEKHNGRIEFESELNKGTSFRVFLPFKT